MPEQTAREQTRYTYRDYLDFPDDFRCEIIDGQIYGMTPSPTARHQRVSGKIHNLIWTHLREQGRACQVFAAPPDVVLAEDQVVQPDLFIVCDRQKIRDHVLGAPDVIFEISSPSTTLKDRREKMQLYERFEVTEYFIVDPEAEFSEKFVSKDRKYGRVGIYAGEDTFRIETVGLELAAKSLFAS